MSKDMKTGYKPSKKTVIIILSLIIMTALILFAGSEILDIGKGKSIEFQQLSKDEIPKKIETEVIPEYRELERALACIIDGKVYVIVTRGEKPTSGYEVSIERITMETEKGKKNLKVNALFSEPEAGISQSKVTTYPYIVSLTELKVLPDNIELIIKY